MGTRVDRWELDTSGLRRSLREGEQEIDKTTSKLKGMGDGAEDAGAKAKKSAKAMKASMAAAAAAAASAALAIRKVVTEVIDLSARANIWAKQAKQFDTTAEEIQKVEGAFGLLTDGTVNAVKSIAKLQRAIVEAKDGVATYSDEFDKLGITGETALDKFASQSVTDQLFQIADAYLTISDKSSQTAISANLLGDRMGALVPAFQNGSTAIREAIVQIEDAGIVSNETAERSEGLQDALALLTRTWDTLVAEVLGPSIPILQDVAEGLQDVVAEAKNSGDVDELGGSIADLVQDLGELAITAADLNAVLGPMLDWVNQLLVPFKALGSAAGFVGDKLNDLNRFSPGKYGKNVQDLTNFTYDLIESIREMTEEARGAYGPFDDVGTVIDDVGDSTTKATDALEEMAEQSGLTVTGIATLRSEYQALGDAIDKNADILIRRTAGVNEAIRAANSEALQLTVDAVNEQAEEMAAAAVMAQSATAGAASAVLGSVADISGSVKDAIVSNSDHMTAKQREAAKVGFAVSKAAGIASATISGIVATQNAVSAVAGIPIVGPILAIAAGVAMTAATAVNVAKIASTAPPKFHSGTSNASEFAATLERGEAVVRKEAMATPGARATVDQLNSGGGAAQAITIVNRVDNQTTFATEQLAIRTGRSPYTGAIESAQPYRRGLRVIKGVND